MQFYNVLESLSRRLLLQSGIREAGEEEIQDVLEDLKEELTELESNYLRISLVEKLNLIKNKRISGSGMFDMISHAEHMRL